MDCLNFYSESDVACRIKLLNRSNFVSIVVTQITCLFVCVCPSNSDKHKLSHLYLSPPASSL